MELNWFSVEGPLPPRLGICEDYCFDERLIRRLGQVETVLYSGEASCDCLGDLGGALVWKSCLLRFGQSVTIFVSINLVKSLSDLRFANY